MSLGDSGALVHAGGAAPADELPPDAWPRYRTKKTIATMTATTKTIMNRSVTQPPPEPQYPLPSHIIAGNHLSQPANQVLTSACPRTQDTKLLRPRPEALRPPAGVTCAARGLAPVKALRSPAEATPHAAEAHPAAGAVPQPAAARRQVVVPVEGLHLRALLGAQGLQGGLRRAAPRIGLV